MVKLSRGGNFFQGSEREEQNEELGKVTETTNKV